MLRQCLISVSPLHPLPRPSSREAVQRIPLTSLAWEDSQAASPSVSGLPAGATGTFNPNPATANSSTLTVTTAATTTTGSFVLTITGVSGALSRTTSVTLVVNAALVPDFSLSATPASQTVVRGGSTTYTANISRLGGFTGGVTFSVSGLPAGATASFSPNPATGNSSLTINTNEQATPQGSYVLTITGVGGGLTRVTSATLVVTD